MHRIPTCQCAVYLYDMDDKAVDNQIAYDAYRVSTICWTRNLVCDESR